MYFDIDAYRGCFKTSPDEAYFWHGQTNKCGGPENARDIAGENGKTLEMCMLGHRDELEKAGVKFYERDNGPVRIAYGTNDQEYNRFWDDCSKAFSEQASGNVHVIEGADPRPNGQAEKDYPSVYNRIEYPALQQNQNVTSITHIDPYTKKPTEVESFNRQRSNPVSSGTGSETTQPPSPKQNGEPEPVGAKKEDLPEMKSPKTAEQSAAGPHNPSQITPVEDSTTLKNLSGNKDPGVNPENEAVSAATKAAGGIQNG